MYAQVTVLRCPMGQMGELRRLIDDEYLSVVCERPGFVSAYLLEQIDDPDSAQLVQFWDDQAAVENMHRTGLLQATVNTLAATLPGLRIHRQGYIVRVAISEHVSAMVS